MSTENLPKLPLEKMALYHFNTCPFCIRVRLAIRFLGIKLELRNIRKDKTHLDDLVQGGGRKTVPCLRMELPDGSIHWQYESADIIKYLRSNHIPR